MKHLTSKQFNNQLDDLRNFYQKSIFDLCLAFPDKDPMLCVLSECVGLQNHVITLGVHHCDSAEERQQLLSTIKTNLHKEIDLIDEYVEIYLPTIEERIKRSNSKC